VRVQRDQLHLQPHRWLRLRLRRLRLRLRRRSRLRRRRRRRRRLRGQARQCLARAVSDAFARRARIRACGGRGGGRGRRGGGRGVLSLEALAQQPRRSLEDAAREGLAVDVRVEACVV